MSNRDKKLLVYLGAILIVAAAYFAVVSPFLGKISTLDSQKSELQMVLNEKRTAFEMQEEYSHKIEETNSQIDAILAKFPEDNTEEKSIMFAVNSEKEIPIWYSQVRFAETTDATVGEETESASDKEAATTAAAIEAVEEAEGDPSDVQEDAGTSEGEETVNEGDFIGRRTDLGLAYSVSYEGFKKFLAYIRDYEDRIVIKDIEAEYNDETGFINGTVTLSQYAILTKDREQPMVDVGDIQLGTDNVFTSKDSASSLDSLDDIMGTLFGGAEGDNSQAVSNTSYFITVDGVVNGGTGKTIGRSNEPSGTTYITSSSNSNENVYFTLTGSNGHYQASYEMAGEIYTDEEFETTSDSIALSVKSTDRISDEDEVEVSLHIDNESDIAVMVSVESDDSERPRVEIVEQNGNVIVEE